MPSIKRLTPQDHAAYCPTWVGPHGAGAGGHGPALYSGYMRKYGSPACGICCPAAYWVTSSWTKAILAMLPEAAPPGASAISIIAGHPAAGAVPDGRPIVEVSLSVVALDNLVTSTVSVPGEPG